MSSLATENAKGSKSWPRVRLGEVCEFRRGLTYSKNDEVASSSIAVLRSNNVELETGKLNLGELKYLRDDFELPPEKFVVRGSILMCMANGSKAHLGKVAIIDIEDQFAFGGFMGLLIPDIERILSSYLYWVLTSYEFKQLIAGLTDGANINNLKFSDIALFEFPLPPLSVQHEIVARLEKDLSMVERMEKGFEAMKAEADQLFKSTLKETFEEVSRGGTKTRRSKLDNVCELIADCPHTTAKNEGKGFPLVRTPNVGYTRLIYENMHRVSEEVYASRTSRGVPMEGDLIFAREAPAGNVAVIQKGEVVCLGQRTVLLRLKSGVAVPDYMAWYILSPEIQKTLLKCSYGATVAHVNVKDIRDLEVGIPPIPTQRKIVAKLDAVRERCEKLKRAAEEGLQTAALMRKAILKEAFA